MIFTAPAILSRISFTSDGGLNLGFITQELTAEEKLKAAKYHKAFGWLLFSEAEIQEDEIPQDDPSREDDKTPSQRLRAVLFVLWEQRGRKAEFETFYRKQIEDAINKVKKLLD